VLAKMRGLKQIKRGFDCTLIQPDRLQRARLPEPEGASLSSRWIDRPGQPVVSKYELTSDFATHHQVNLEPQLDARSTTSNSSDE
jgi:hypothetical protein